MSMGGLQMRKDGMGPVTCHNCGGLGHYKHNCPFKATDTKGGSKGGGRGGEGGGHMLGGSGGSSGEGGGEGNRG